MAYLGDIRENRVGPNGEFWESDNRIEERHYYNGMFIDLCNLPAEEYTKTIFVTSGSTSTDDTSKTKNVMSVRETKGINSYGVEVHGYQAFATKPVASRMVIKMKVQDSFDGEEDIELVIEEGASESNIYLTMIDAQMKAPTIITSNYEPKEDDKYEYDTKLPEKEPDYPMAYSITMLKNDFDAISNDELATKLLESGKVSMKDEKTSEILVVDFTKNSVPVEGFSNMTVPEMDEVLFANAQDIIIVTDRVIKSIAEANTNIPETELWTKRESTINLEGVDFYIWYKREVDGQTAQSSVYDPVTNEMGGAQEAKYIIYYE